MAKKTKAKSQKRKSKVNVALCFVLAIFLSSYILVSMSEKMNFKYIPTMQEVVGIFEGKENELLKSDCSVHFINVGQGDSALILSDGNVILIDAGENDKGNTVVDYLKELKIEKVDLLIATHPHSDHIGGMDAVINEFDIGKIVMPKLSDSLVPTTRTYTDVLQAIANKGLQVTPAKVTMKFEFGKGELVILGPIDEYNDLNDTSLVAKFTYDNDESFLFTGDIEKTAEKALVNSQSSLESDVLKVAHHGSKTSTTQSFYEEVSPSYCVISVGDGNRHKHPNQEVIERIKQSNAKVYRTDYDGSIVFSVTQGELKVTTTGILP